jgi:hypothetical protein
MILGPSPGQVKHHRNRTRTPALNFFSPQGRWEAQLRSTRMRGLLVGAVALLTASAALPAAAAERPCRHPR